MSVRLLALPIAAVPRSSAAPWRLRVFCGPHCGQIRHARAKMPDRLFPAYIAFRGYGLLSIGTFAPRLPYRNAQKLLMFAKIPGKVQLSLGPRCFILST